MRTAIAVEPALEVVADRGDDRVLIALVSTTAPLPSPPRESIEQPAEHHPAGEPDRRPRRRAERHGLQHGLLAVCTINSCSVAVTTP